MTGKNTLRNAKGFTLIELGMVVLLLGVLLLVVSPKFGEITETQIKSAARRLSATIKYLYSEAAFKKRPYRLRFDLDRDEYWIELLEGNEFVETSDPVLRRKSLPVGVHFKDLVTPRNTEKIEKGGEDFILFSPRGFVEPAVIHLETEGGTNYTVATKPLTGGTIVTDGYVEFFKEERK